MTCTGLISIIFSWSFFSYFSICSNKFCDSVVHEYRKIEAQFPVFMTILGHPLRLHNLAQTPYSSFCIIKEPHNGICSKSVRSIEIHERNVLNPRWSRHRSTDTLSSYDTRTRLDHQGFHFFFKHVNYNNISPTMDEIRQTTMVPLVVIVREEIA